MNKSLFTIWIFAKLNTRRFFRDRLAIFFVIVFPLIFLFVFGGLFGNEGGGSFSVGLVNKSESQFSQEFTGRLEADDFFEVTRFDSREAASDQLQRGQIEALIILPKQFGVSQAGTNYPSGQAQVSYTQNNEQAGQTLTSVLAGIFETINVDLVGVERPFTVSSEASNEQGLSQFDYTFSGLLGFSIIGLGVFGPVNVFPELKKQGILRRFHTTPLRVWQYFLSSVISQMATGLVAVGVMFAVALTVFDLRIFGNVLELAVFIMLSIAMIYGIGLAIGGWAKNERQAAPLGNIIVFPMMFLSGTFFPRFLMPDWLQSASAFLPLTPVIDGIRLILTEGQSLIDVSTQIWQITAWLVVIYVIAFRVFRWE
ncbi:MAG TPA: ABC transporter permease [Candidatus Saccharimonadales bacterium]